MILSKTDVMVDSSVHFSTMIIIKDFAAIHSVVIHACPLVMDQFRNNTSVLKRISRYAIDNREILVNAL